MELLVWLGSVPRITLENRDLGGSRTIKARSVSLQALTSSVAIINLILGANCSLLHPFGI